MRAKEKCMFDLSGKTALVTGAPEHRAGERSEAVARATIK
jgi:hypothetical protein